jgi:hypothetical protein
MEKLPWSRTMDKRLHPRVIVNPPGRVRFRLRGQTHEAYPIANIGINGCCIIAPAHLAGFLETRPLLEEWRLLAPGLPPKSIQAQVIWIDPTGGVLGQDFRAGVQFQGKPSGFTNLMLRYVAMRWKAQARDAH